MPEFTKLGDLIGSTMTIKSVGDPVYKMWDVANKKMLFSEEWQEDYRKVYPAETDKGLLDLGAGQLGTLLAETFKDGKADLVDKTFEVKSNGKDGLDRRYFFNLVEAKPEPPQEQSPLEGLE